VPDGQNDKVDRERALRWKRGHWKKSNRHLDEKLSVSYRRGDDNKKRRSFDG
jgi:hypothetical protein